MTRYLLFVQNSYEQNCFSREFLGISELYKVGITQKKFHQRVLTDCFEKTSEDKTSFCLASHKRNLLALSHDFWIRVFITKLLAKTVERQSLAKYS